MRQRRRIIGRLLAGAVLLAFAAGCQEPPPGDPAVEVLVSAIVPDAGGAGGGTLVRLTGSRFPDDGSITVTFGGAVATNVVRVSATEVTLRTPTHAAGVVDLVLDSSDGSLTRSAGYTYLAGGTQSDGPLSVTGNQAVNKPTTISANVAVGATSAVIKTPPAFAATDHLEPGDELLFVNVLGGGGAGAGDYTVIGIRDVQYDVPVAGETTVTFTKPYDAASPAMAPVVVGTSITIVTQVIPFKHYTTVTVPAGATLTSDPYDPTTGLGGVLAFTADNIDIAGSIDVSALGFGGGGGGEIADGNGAAGGTGSGGVAGFGAGMGQGAAGGTGGGLGAGGQNLSDPGLASDPSPNTLRFGGGGGSGGGGGGGGGGYAGGFGGTTLPGADGGNGGEGGSSTAAPGSTGGGGGSGSTTAASAGSPGVNGGAGMSGAAGRGGGLLILVAGSLTGNGSILANGGTGDDGLAGIQGGSGVGCGTETGGSGGGGGGGGAGGGGGGGGAGGTLWIASESIAPTLSIGAGGGAGGGGGTGGGEGSGGVSNGLGCGSGQGGGAGTGGGTGAGGGNGVLKTGP